MKRRRAFSIQHSAFSILLLAATVAAIWPSTATAGRYQKGGQDTDGVYIVLGSNLASAVRGGRHVYRSDGTHDEVELQRGFDAAAAVNGVCKVYGDFVVSKPAGAGTEYTANSATYTDATKTLSTIVFDGTYTINDVSVGDIIRLWDGDDGGGATLEDNYEEYVVSVSAVNTGAGTITLSSELPSYETDYTGVKFRRLVSCLKVTDECWIVGGGIEHSEIKLATDQNCDILHVEGTGGGVHPWLIRGVEFNGNYASQGDHDTSVFDARCNGLVFGEASSEVHLEDVNVMGCKGDAVWICATDRAAVITKCWFGWGSGGGLYSVGSDLSVMSTRCYELQGPAIAVMNCGFAQIFPRYAHTNGGAYTRDSESQCEYTVKLLNCANVTLSCPYIDATETDVLGCLYMYYCRGCSVTGTGFYPVGADRHGIKFAKYVSSCTFTGNTFYRLGQDSVESDSFSYTCCGNVIKNNAGMHAEDAQDCSRLINDSGATQDSFTVVIRSGDDGFTVTSGAGSVGRADVAGVVAVEAVVNGSRGRIQTLGLAKYIKVKSADAVNYVAGTELCVSGREGCAQPATTGDWVFALAQASHTGSDPESTHELLGILIKGYEKP